VISGQGELHIETKLHRILREHNLKVSLGRVNVSFKEAATGSHEASHTFQRKLKTGFKFLQLDLLIESMSNDELEECNGAQVEIDLFRSNPAAKRQFDEYLKVLDEIEEAKKATAAISAADSEAGIAPKSSGAAKGKHQPKTSHEKMAENLKYARLSTITNPTEFVALNNQHDFGDNVIESIYDLSMMQYDLLAELYKTLRELTVKGPLAYSPLVDTRIVVTGGRFNPKFIDPISMRMAASETYAICLKAEHFNILEPVVEVQITCKSDSVNEIISNAISQRKGRMGAILAASVSETEFTVSIPLLTSVNYSSYLRSVTNGEVKMSMKNSGYIRASQERKMILLRSYV
jgi:translation elongation factor EF-G